MPIGNVNKEPAPKRETFRPPWVKDKTAEAEAAPAWTQGRKLKPVETAKKAAAPVEEEPAPVAAKPGLKREFMFV